MINPCPQNYRRTLLLAFSNISSISWERNLCHSNSCLVAVENIVYRSLNHIAFIANGVLNIEKHVNSGLVMVR